MAQYNLPNFAQGNYTYGNMNQWGMPQGGLPSFNTSAENPIGADLSFLDESINPDNLSFVGGQGQMPKFSGFSLTDLGNANQFADKNYSLFPNIKPPEEEEPEKVGGWIKPAQFGLAATRVGTGIFNAAQSAEMNKFMREYYGDMRDLQQADFANSARSTNTALEGQRERQLDSQGIAAGSAENTARVADFMKRHGVNETA